MLLAVACAGTVAAEDISITTPMAFEYVGRLLDSLQACDARWLQENLLPSAKIRLVYADGTGRTVGATQYVREFRATCVPYEFQHFYDNSSASQISVKGPMATARWQFSWGEKDSGKPKVLFKCYTKIVSKGNKLRIAAVEDRTVELVPGGEKAYLRRVNRTTFLDDFLNWAYQFVPPKKPETPAP